MDKVLLIIQREYLTRVRKKSFIIMIFVVPGLILGMGFIVKLLSKNSDQLATSQSVNVIDDSKEFTGKFRNGKNIKFQDIRVPVAEAKKDLKKNENESLLIIPSNYTAKGAVKILSGKKASFVLTGEIERQMDSIAVNNSMVKNNLSPALINSLKSNISVNAVESTDTGDKDANLAANMLISIACAILIYMSLLIYGSQVMRGVIEEKTSRIIEVIISSVKPFQLMLGKIIGVGLVGLTQFGAWVILSALSTKIAGHNAAAQGSMAGMLAIIATIPFGKVLGCFIFYFLTGYLLYSALFAAVGSAVDSESETQQFMFPITLPLLFTYFLSVSVLFKAPDSPLAVWLSIIPFTAPVAMMVREPLGGVPPWQLYTSMAMMIIGFLFTTYVASRIYRVGILMYGKKASFKELGKWFFYRE